MDDILIKQTPHSIEAEQAVLGSIMIDARCVPDIVEILKADDFYSSVNKEIFACICSMFNYSQTIDPVTLLEKMRADGVWNDGSPAYIRDLMLITPTAANVKEYAAIVKDKSLLRGIAEAGADINAMAISGEGGADNILEAAEKKVYNLRQGRQMDKLEPISSILISVYDRILRAAKSGSEIPGLPTGLHDLDRYIMGLNDSDLIIIAARPGVGKTSIALNIALHVAKTSGKAVAVYSLEMSRADIALRLLSAESYVDGRKLQTGRIKEDEWRRLAEAAASISATNLLISDDSTLTVTRMNAQCRRVKDLGLIVIDYLQLMQAASDGRDYHNENRTQVVTQISRMMKIMAKELNVPVICLSQLNRANERQKDKRPQLSTLRESGSIEQDADIVIGLHSDDDPDDESETHNIVECIILKNRRGETGKIELQWLPEYTSYTSLEMRHNDGNF